LKENLLWVRTFDTIEELRAALVEFTTRTSGEFISQITLPIRCVTNLRDV
jgi:hypothetical protein